MTAQDDQHAQADEDVTAATAPDEPAPPEISFADGLPGFPQAHSFVLEQLDESGLVFALRNVEDTELRFIVVPPASFFPDYAPPIDDQTIEDLALMASDEPLLLVVITFGESIDDATGNLLAPLVVNPRTRRAAQMVMSGSDLPLRAPLRSWHDR